MAETEAFEDDTLEKLLLEEIKDFSSEDKKNIYYILEKDYQIELPLERFASKFNSEIIKKKLEVKPEQNIKEEQKNKAKSEKAKQDYNKKLEKDKEDYTWNSSFPSSPPMWGGFSYQAIVPYQQSNQINFWSLASQEEKDTLNKIAKTKK